MQTSPPSRSFRWVSRRSWLFLAGVITFAVFSYVPVLRDARSASDMILYQRYAASLLASPSTLPTEYPPLTALVFALPQLIAPEHYYAVFTGLAALVTWLMVLAVDRMSGRGWWLMLFLVLGTGGTLFSRFDVYVVLVTVLALLAVQGRRWELAQCWLVLGFALKLYPVLLMPLVVAAEWQTTRRMPWRSALSGAALLGVAAGSMALLVPEQIATMLGYHSARPLEFESVGASIIWLLGPTQMGWSFGSLNLLSSSSAAVIQGLMVVNIVALLAIYCSALLGRISGAGAWALLLLFSIATSKVFSTQYLIWALPFVVLAGGPDGAGLSTRRAVGQRWVWLAICALTTIVFPIGFGLAETSLKAFVIQNWLMALVTARNACWLLACVLGVRAWWHMAARQNKQPAYIGGEAQARGRPA